MRAPFAPVGVAPSASARGGSVPPLTALRAVERSSRAINSSITGTRRASSRYGMASAYGSESMNTGSVCGAARRVPGRGQGRWRVQQQACAAGSSQDHMLPPSMALTRRHARRQARVRRRAAGRHMHMHMPGGTCTCTCPTCSPTSSSEAMGCWEAHAWKTTGMHVAMIASMNDLRVGVSPPMCTQNVEESITR